MITVAKHNISTRHHFAAFPQNPDCDLLIWGPGQEHAALSCQSSGRPFLIRSEFVTKWRYIGSRVGTIEMMSRYIFRVVRRNVAFRLFVRL